MPLPSFARRSRNKYNAQPVELDGHRFASKAEARRYAELRILQRAGRIADLELQPVFVLAPSVRLAGAARATPALRYVADFRYRDARTGAVVVEDIKGGEVTEGYRIKRHLMKALLGIDIVEIR